MTSFQHIFYLFKGESFVQREKVTQLTHLYLNQIITMILSLLKTGMSMGESDNLPTDVLLVQGEK